MEVDLVLFVPVVDGVVDGVDAKLDLGVLKVPPKGLFCFLRVLDFVLVGVNGEIVLEMWGNLVPGGASLISVDRG